MANMQVISPSLDGEDVASNLQEDGTTAITWTVSTATEHKFLNNGRVVLQIEKGATAASLVVASQVSVGGLDVEDRTITIDASSTKLYGPFPPNIHNETTGSDVGYTGIHFTGDVTGLEVTAFRLA